tara:strand:+ start:3040 stop:3225 length:186 start_codon:yes stop_codon:yes gene_type:complete
VRVLYFICGTSMTKRLIVIESSKMNNHQQQTLIIELLLMARQWKRKVGASIKIIKNRKGGL